MHAQQRLVCRTAAIAFAVIVCGSSFAEASLMFDLRAREVSGPGVTKISDKIVDVHSLGGKVLFDVWAVIQGTDADLTNDRLVLYSFRIKSNGVGSIGNMFNVNDPINDPPILGPVNGWEVGAGAAPGTLQDLDSDGDKDIGATDARFAISLEGNANGFGGAPAYTGTGPVAEFHVYSFEMPITQLRLGNVTVQLERSPIPTAFEWREDVPTGYNKNGLNGTVGVTNGVAINVIPEPGTIALAIVGLAGVALAIRRRT